MPSAPAGACGSASRRSASATRVAVGTMARPPASGMTRPTVSASLVKMIEPGDTSLPAGTAQTGSGHNGVVMVSNDAMKAGRTATAAATTSLTTT